MFTDAGCSKDLLITESRKGHFLHMYILQNIEFWLYDNLRLEFTLGMKNEKLTYFYANWMDQE